MRLLLKKNRLKALFYKPLLPHEKGSWRHSTKEEKEDQTAAVMEAPAKPRLPAPAVEAVDFCQEVSQVQYCIEGSHLPRQT